MYKRFALLISFCIFVGVSMVIIGVYSINNANWKKFENEYIEQKQILMNYYLQSVESDMYNGIASHAHWTEAIEALELKEDEWLAENATTYIVDMSLFSVDYILIANEDMSFTQESKGDLESMQDKILLREGVQKSLKNNEVVTEFDQVNNLQMMIMSSPFLDNDGQNPTGVYVTVSVFDQAQMDAFAHILGEKELVTLLIVANDEYTERMENISGNKYQNIMVEAPILNSDYHLISRFELDAVYDTFIMQRNYIFSIVIVSAGIVCIVILIFLKGTTNKIEYINDKVDEIAQGNYDIHMNVNGSRFFAEILNLSKSINIMSQDIKKHIATIDNNYLEMTDVIVDAVEINDRYTSQHNKAVGSYAKIIAEEINYHNIDEIVMAAKLHDIGKISIPGAILNKPGKLTPEEYEIIKTHPTEGYKIIHNIDYFSNVKMGVKYHHERWDGSGYPDGLKGDEIPLIAQIIAIADVYDALTSDRAYRQSLSHEEAEKIILDNSGKMFNPLLVKAFCNKDNEFRSELEIRK